MKMPNLGGMNMGNLMKQAQKMQRDIADKQAELAQREYTGTAGGGVVSVTMKGSKTVASVVIAPEAIDLDDIEMLQDLVAAAANQALKMADDAEKEEIKSIAGGVNMPF